MPKITDEKLAELKAKYSNTEWLSHPAFEDKLLARPINDGEYSIYRRKMTEDEVVATRFLVETAVAWPELTELRRGLSAQPFAVNALAVAIIKMSGGNAEAVREKA